jgi:hypothetical protein
MRGKTKIIAGAVLIIAVGFATFLLFSPLAIFSRKISHADRAVVNLLPTSVGPPVSITITGRNLQDIARMISSAHRDRKDYDCSPLTTVRFFKDTELLGEMTTCVQLIWIDHRQYRDDTKLLEKFVVNPLLEEKLESAIRRAIQ